MNQVDQSNDGKALSIVTWAMISGILIFAAISLLIHYSRGRFVLDETLPKKFFWVILLGSSVLFMVAAIFFEKRFNIIKGSDLVPHEKIENFRILLLIHLSIGETVAIVAIICFIVFGEFLFFLVVCLALLAMIRKFPRSEKINELL